MALETPSHQIELRLPPAGFAPPDWGAPLDVENLLSEVPDDATAKGMFLARLLKEVTALGLSPPTTERFQAFHDYPLKRHLELHVEVASLLYPNEPPREGLRRLAGLAYQAFSETHIGKVILGVMGRDPVRIMKLAGRAMSHSSSIGRTETEVIDERTVIIPGLRDLPFPRLLLRGCARGTSTRAWLGWPSRSADAGPQLTGDLDSLALGELQNGLSLGLLDLSGLPMRATPLE